MKKVVTLLLSLSIILFGQQLYVIEASNNSSVNDYFNEEEGVQTEQEQDNTQVPENNTDFQSDRSLFLDFIKMIFALVVVLGLIYFLLKFIQKRNRLYQQSRSLENLGGLSLGTNKSVQIIRVGQKYYLVGVGEDIQLLSEIDDEETIRGLVDQQQIETKSFQDILKSFQRNSSNPYKEEDQQNQFKNQLDSMKKTREQLMKRYQNRNEGSKDE
ncbi:flagellar biosynthetic protein FliO [Piscibacillus sp. B03]|uniref:flagellar biosynthetic protein FliO n=1 Tax=Piscibacillus sp. B03 TaxID=3457430 RepID=UPI003FCEDD4C